MPGGWAIPPVLAGIHIATSTSRQMPPAAAGAAACQTKHPITSSWGASHCGGVHNWGQLLQVVRQHLKGRSSERKALQWAGRFDWYTKPAPPGGAPARVWEGWGTHTTAMSASLQQITAQLPAYSDAERGGSSSPPNSRYVQPLAVQACMEVGCAAQARLVVQALVGAQQLVQDGVTVQVGVVGLPQLAHHALCLQWIGRR